VPPSRSDLSIGAGRGEGLLWHNGPSDRKPKFRGDATAVVRAGRPGIAI
jgi:hypothetical protein